MGIKKKMLILISSFSLFAGYLVPVKQIFADEVTPSNSQTTPVPIFSEEEEAAILEYAEEIGVERSSSEVIITDSQFIKLLEFIGFDTTALKSTITPFYREGVTKVVSKGDGSWDIYLSQTWVSNYYLVAEIAAGLIGILVPGVGWALAYGIVAALAAFIGNNIKGGVLIKVRSWGLSDIQWQ